MSRAARRSVWLLPLLGDRSLGGREVFAAASEKELHNDCRMVYNVPMTGAEQMEGIADRTYYDTGEAIKVGDVIYLDNHRGVVEVSLNQELRIPRLFPVKRRVAY